MLHAVFIGNKADVDCKSNQQKLTPDDEIPGKASPFFPHGP